MTQSTTLSSPGERGSGLHENFKIISNGRELPFPWMRIFALMFVSFVGGYLLALFDVAIELHRRFPHAG